MQYETKNMVITVYIKSTGAVLDKLYILLWQMFSTKHDSIYHHVAFTFIITVYTVTKGLLVEDPRVLAVGDKQAGRIQNAYIK